MAGYGERTEQPTQRRIEKARADGRFPFSREFVNALQFLACVWLVVGFGSQWFHHAASGFRGFLQEAVRAEVTPLQIQRLFGASVRAVFLPLVFAGLAVTAFTVGVQLALTQFGLSAKRLAPDLKRLSPMQRLRELPRQNTWQFLQALVLLPLFCLVVFLVVRENLGAFLKLPYQGVAAGLGVVASSLEQLLWRASLLFLAWGVLDLMRTRSRYWKELRMSKQEIREEAKEAEGNPQMKGRIRRLQRDLARRRMMREVPTATAVVVNPTHFAVAIRYSMESGAAPVVVAKGKNYLALRIRKLAIENQVPIVENPPLAQSLYKSVDVGQEIPPALYRAVAEILAYIYTLTQGRRR
ncbi:MAG: EscU/YscU/HrcU family type III secretion system export apparatus switch protein [Bryobacteraceae bacterium]